jgi:hypothetical protein
VALRAGERRAALLAAGRAPVAVLLLKVGLQISDEGAEILRLAAAVPVCDSRAHESLEPLRVAAAAAHRRSGFGVCLAEPGRPDDPAPVFPERHWHVNQYTGWLKAYTGCMSDIPYKWHTPEYAARRLTEIKQQHYPDGDTLQMIADFEWLIDEAEYLRAREAAR